MYAYNVNTAYIPRVIQALKSNNYCWLFTVFRKKIIPKTNKQTNKQNKANSYRFWCMVLSDHRDMK